MKISVSLTVNGKPVSAEIESRTLLVAGALPAALFALVVHVIFELLERAVTPGFVPPK